MSHALAVAIVYSFETGRLGGRRDAIADAVGDRGGVSYGPWQAADASGALDAVIDRYIDHGGVFANAFRDYLPMLAKSTLPLRGNKAFKTLLKKAAADSKMWQAQDEIFKLRYMDPALTTAKYLGFTTKLGFLVTLDSHVQSGSILGFLRRRFDAVPPNKGGDELVWLQQYLTVRQDWLDSMPAPLPATQYRTRTMLELLNGGNTDLAMPLNIWVGKSQLTYTSDVTLPTI